MLARLCDDGVHREMVRISPIYAGLHEQAAYKKFRMYVFIRFMYDYIVMIVHVSLARGVGRGFVPGLERAIDEAGDV